MKWTAALALMFSIGAFSGFAQDWPQWRGPNRDAKAADFKAPKTWPKELTEKWKVTVGEGVATPALVGDKLFVFSRQDGNEITRCLNAADGKELWSEKYESLGATGGASQHSGPRSSPANGPFRGAMAATRHCSPIVRSTSSTIRCPIRSTASGRSRPRRSASTCCAKNLWPAR